MLREWAVEYDSVVAITEYLREEYGIESIVLDNSAADIDHPTLAERGFRISTANKLPLATMPYEQFVQTIWPRYGWNTTVMAGKWVVNDVESSVKAGNTIQSVEGVFSGTLWFIMSELEAGKKLSEAIRSAIDNGFTEPNPMDDLDGMDVAKKLVIIARYAGHDVSLGDFEVKWLLDNSYRRFFPEWWNKDAQWKDDDEKKRTAIDAFIAAVADQEDEKFEGKVRKAKEKDKSKGGCVLRYLAKMDATWDGLFLSVGLDEEVPRDSDIWQLVGSDNIAIIKTDVEWWDKTDKWKGAWIATTADSVVREYQRVMAAA